MDFTPSAGEELQSEFFVPREHAYEAMKKLFALGDQITPHLLTSEIRTIAGDNLWMSPCYKRPSVAFHFTWKQKPKAVKKILPVIEETLAPYEVRPHWGKVFTMNALTIASRYPKIAHFKELLMQYDPNGKFRNSYLQKYIFASYEQ
nr:D-arabinono-1,4-lactone oxidase [Fodinibius salsisoli]